MKALGLLRGVPIIQESISLHRFMLHCTWSLLLPACLSLDSTRGFEGLAGSMGAGPCWFHVLGLRGFGADASGCGRVGSPLGVDLGFMGLGIASRTFSNDATQPIETKG